MTRARKQKTQAEIDLDRKAKVIRAKLKKLDGLHRRTLAAAIDIGRDLADCKSTVSDGEWMAWLEKERIEYRTAKRLLDLFDWSQRDPAGFDRRVCAARPTSKPTRCHHETASKTAMNFVETAQQVNR